MINPVDDGDSARRAKGTRCSELDFEWLKPGSPEFEKLFGQMAREITPDKMVRDLQDWTRAKLCGWGVQRPADHADIFGDLLLRLAKRKVRNQFDPRRGSLRSFLKGILWNVYREFRRKWQSVRGQPPANNRDLTCDPSAVVQHRERIRRFRGQFDELPEDEQDLLMWRTGLRFDRCGLSSRERDREYVRRSRCLTRLRRYGEDGRWGRRESL